MATSNQENPDEPEFPAVEKVWDTDAFKTMLEGLARQQLGNRIDSDRLDNQELDSLKPHFDDDVVIDPEVDLIESVEKVEDVDPDELKYEFEGRCIELYRVTPSNNIYLTSAPIGKSTVSKYVHLSYQNSEYDDDGQLQAFYIQVKSYDTVQRGPNG